MIAAIMVLLFLVNKLCYGYCYSYCIIVIIGIIVIDIIVSSSITDY